MDARRRRGSTSPAAGAAAVPLLLLLAVSLWNQAAAAGGDAPAAETELQKHVAFFDRDKDGIISFSETYEGFRALGFGAAISKVSATFINGAIGPKTRPKNATAPLLSIYIENIHKGIHGSDTSSYDAQGRFVPEKFEEIFSKHAKTVGDALSSAELKEMLEANRKPMDLTGWLAASKEWSTLFDLAKGQDGLLRKDTVRTVYDGSLFYKLARNGSSHNHA